MKTNAARILDRFGIAYDLCDYEVDRDDLSAEKVAAQIGMPAETTAGPVVAEIRPTVAVPSMAPGSSISPGRCC